MKGVTLDHNLNIFTQLLKIFKFEVKIQLTQIYVTNNQLGFHAEFDADCTIFNVI